MKRHLRMALRTAMAMPAEDRFELVGLVPALPIDRPTAVYTHATDAAAQAAIEATDRPIPTAKEAS